MGIGAAGTVQSRNKGLDLELEAIKRDFKNGGLPLGKYYPKVSDAEVGQFAWQDSALVLFMSTVGTLQAFNEARWRLGKKQTFKKPFLADHYNIYMNGVDIADQMKSFYSVQ